ncbi:hypothetical protein [Magnetospira sp. QH-2]|uniref:hypothetical protein n=1 Tax=Magnetospira sp. (strain QH-2) TaxID=1288970 RepID=UPI0003E80EE6|nr:hypothetical protein [Magnetospira sp. QH-2]CCQ75014.1 putative glycolate reductase [Magnetospira sp. QH-2]
MTDQPPILLVTRTLPEAVEDDLQLYFEPRLNGDDAPYEEDEIADFAADAAGMVVSPTDPITAQVIENLDETVRVIATFSVATDHMDLSAAKARGIVVTHIPRDIPGRDGDASWSEAAGRSLIDNLRAFFDGREPADRVV